ncbi:unnamed protein product, partial [Prorocentrum cordatum]
MHRLKHFLPWIFSLCCVCRTPPVRESSPATMGADRRLGRGRGGALLAGLLGAAALGAPRAFLPGPPAEDPSRRELALGAALPVLLGAQQAMAMPRVTDMDTYVNRRKLELVPIFKQGIDYL